ncbi:MAG: hypothetical protein KC503_19465 [Myxococcales bacterium]|nr:hypothetical protein [Myxococcales bacterium]
MSGKITTKIHDAFSAEGKAAVKKLGFDTHGLVVRNGDGSVAHKEDGHNFKQTDIEGWIKKAM